MTDELPVHVSQGEIHSLDVPASFETDGPFDVMFVNHGQSVHVHLHLDDDLSEVASIEASNHYVEGDSQRAVRVNVAPGGLSDGPIRGKLKVVSGYGAVTRWIDIELQSEEEESGSVEVDESLATPQPREPEPADQPLLGRPELPVLGLGALALVVAVLAAVYVRDTLVLLGSLAVLGVALVALFVLLRG